MEVLKETGKTKSAGFLAGIRRTFLTTKNKAWEQVFSPEGLLIWLGLSLENVALNCDYTNPSGDTFTVKVFRPYSHIRLRWRRKDWTHNSTLQVRIIEATDNKTTISFHQENLDDEQQREEMLAHWKKVLKYLEQVVL